MRCDHSAGEQGTSPSRHFTAHHDSTGRDVFPGMLCSRLRTRRDGRGVTTPPGGPRRYGQLLSDIGTHRATDHYRRVHHGVWEPNETLRSSVTRLAAATLAVPGAVATGWLAAAIHGHPWLPRDYSVELAVGSRRVRRPGITVRRYDVPDDRVETFLDADGNPLLVASPEWMLFDLARHLGRDEAVVALDGAWRMNSGIDARLALPPLIERYLGLRGRRIALDRCSLVDPKSQSPMETRLRMFLYDLGITHLVSQYKVSGTPYYLDFADPERMIAVEYDGDYHNDPKQHAKDVERRNRLEALGWRFIQVTKRQFYFTRDELARQLLRALG